MRLPQPVRAALRTFIQSWAGTMIGLWALSGISPDTFQGITDLRAIGKMAMAAAIGTIPALLALLQNGFENKTGRDFLISKRQPDPEPTDPPADQPLITPSEEPGDLDPPVVKKAPPVKKAAKKASKTTKKG